MLLEFPQHSSLPASTKEQPFLDHEVGMIKVALRVVVEGGISGAMFELNLSCGALVRTTCTPLREVYTPYMYTTEGGVHPSCIALLVVVEGGISGAMFELYLSCGALVRTTCTPLRTYEAFAKNVCKVEDEKLTGPHDKFKVKGDIFWMEAQVDYQGLTIQCANLKSFPLETYFL